MESDDDYQSFSPLEESSPPTQTRKLKRLKKTIRISENPIVNSSGEESFSVPLVDSSNSDDALDSSEPQGLEDSNEPLRFGSESEGLDGEKESGDGFESSHFRSESVGFDEENELNFGSESSHLKESGLGVKRALEFDVVDGEGEGENVGGGGGEEIRGEDADSDDKKRRNSEEPGERKEKKKNKRVKSDGDEEKRKVAVSDKRRAEKERRDYLKHLHAESQRLLRETRDAAFKPVSVIQKPISSILEKIRQRKLEVSKLFVSRKISTCENDDSPRDILMDLDSENTPIDERGDDESGKVAIEETSMRPTDVGSSLDASDINGSTKPAEDSSHEHIPSQALDEAKHAFRAPIDDTQDLFCDSQSSDSRDEQPSEQDDSPVEEAFAPSLLAMNLKFDSAPPDEMSSDEEDNDKENIYPSEPGLKLCSTSKGDPVKAFLDEEAVEEDDSDNDLSRFKDNEEEDEMEDAQELKDMIATAYEEKPIDDERRHELHMKWLEQQDSFGTDKLLQKFGCGSKYEETTLLEEEDDREDDEEEFSDEATENLLPLNVARMNAKKVKQMIPQMFTDKDDVYLSSDDEETEKLIVKQRLLRKAQEDQATFLSPVEDESSREVFGLIKKLNIVPDTKKKAKASSSFDMMSTRRSNSSTKSSFLGKVSNNSMSSSHKRVSSTVRSYIFGRDDSSSRSAITVSEDSSDTIQKEVRSTKTFSAKFNNSQSKSSSQNSETTVETISGTSLFEILRRSSLQTKHSNRDEVVAQTQSVFAAFKLSKQSMKIERQS